MFESVYIGNFNVVLRLSAFHYLLHFMANHFHHSDYNTAKKEKYLKRHRSVIFGFNIPNNI